MISKKNKEIVEKIHKLTEDQGRRNQMIRDYCDRRDVTVSQAKAIARYIVVNK